MSARNIPEGLYFTGMWCSRWDRKGIEKYTQEVKELKKKYKCRCVKLADKDGYGWYGDENFNAVQWDTEEKCQEMIDSVPNRIKQAKADYEKKLQEIAEWQQMWIDKKRKFEELRK